MPKVELFDRNEVITKAINLFWKKGYGATSLSDLTEELGIGKSSLYNTFGSKRQLFDHCLSIYGNGGSELIDKLLRRESDPIYSIRLYLEFQSNNLLKDPLSKGCLIANTSAEMASDEEIERFLLEYNQSMKSAIVNYLIEGPLADQAEEIADSLLIYTTGVSIMSKYIKDPKRFNASHDQFIKSLMN